MESIIIEACENATKDHNCKVDEDEQRGDSQKECVSEILHVESPRTRRSRNSITSPLDYGSRDANIGSNRERSISDTGSHLPLSKSQIAHLKKRNSEHENSKARVQDNHSIHNSNEHSDHSRFPEFVVLDCSFVTGFDANATVGLFKLKKRLANMELGESVPLPIFLFFAGVQDSMQDMFNVHMSDSSR